MNHLLAAQLPLIHPPSKVWYRSVDQRYQYDAPLASDTATRFNPGDQPDLKVMYFAPSQLLARFEARDLLGSWFGEVVPSDGSRHVVVEYCIDLGSGPAIVDIGPERLVSITTSIQEMTGDWITYPWGSVPAPTQRLATSVFERADKPMGLLAPSARNPRQNNLILFASRLPPGSVSFVDVHAWHESQILVPP